MFGLFKKKAAASQPPSVLYFKGNPEAFAYACEWIKSDTSAGSYLVGLIEKASIDDAGKQTALIRIQHKGGGRTTALPVLEGLPLLNVGDLVALKVLQDFSMDGVSAVYGDVVAVLEPEFSLEKGWKTAAR